MKNCVALILAVLMVLGLCACNADAPGETTRRWACCSFILYHLLFCFFGGLYSEYES